MSETGISFEKAMDAIKDVTGKARMDIREELKKDPRIRLKKGENGCGKDTDYNDRSMYHWITACGSDDKEYELAFFYSEIDVDSGNCHCQLGRLMFVKGLIKNPGSNITSPNEVICNKPGETTIVFHSNKWINPLDYIFGSDKPQKEEFQKKLANGKWITVDDVCRDESIKQFVVKAFVKFILESPNADAK